MFARVSETNLTRLKYQQIPLHHLLPRGCEDPFVHFLDETHDQTTRDSSQCLIKDIPPDYLPKPGVYIEANADPVASSPYTVLIQNEWSNKEFYQFSRSLFSAYSAAYAFSKLYPVDLSVLPAYHGFNGAAFYDDLIVKVPSEVRPRIDALQYASPGYIRYRLDSEVMHRVVEVIRRIRQPELSDPYSRLRSFYIEHGYTSQDPPAPTPEMERDAEQYTRRLVSAIGLFSYEQMTQGMADAFLSGKIMLTLTERLRTLRRFETNQQVTFPPTRSGLF